MKMPRNMWLLWIALGIMLTFWQITKKDSPMIEPAVQTLELNGEEISIASMDQIAATGEKFSVGDYVMEERFYFILITDSDTRYAVEVDKNTFNRGDLDVGSSFVAGETLITNREH